MGDKHNDHSKKKLTKKQLKAQNHAKLMASKGSPSNVVDINAFKKTKTKKPLKIYTTGKAESSAFPMV